MAGLGVPTGVTSAVMSGRYRTFRVAGSGSWCAGLSAAMRLSGRSEVRWLG